MADDSDKPADSSPDEQLTWAGNRPLTTRWWWSPALMIVVGVVVAWYQNGPIRSGHGIVLNWVMVAVGVAVAIAGLVSLRRAHVANRAEAAEAPTGDEA